MTNDLMKMIIGMKKCLIVANISKLLSQTLKYKFSKKKSTNDNQ